jgi:hypothetical protein
MSKNGKFKECIKDRISKATRAAFIINQAVSTNYNISVSVSHKLLQQQIFPILTYGSAIWGAPEKFHTAYLRQVAAEVQMKEVKKGLDIETKECRRIGPSNGTTRDILIKFSLKNIEKFIVKGEVTVSSKWVSMALWHTWVRYGFLGGWVSMAHFWVRCDFVIVA